MQTSDMHMQQNRGNDKNIEASSNQGYRMVYIWKQTRKAKGSQTEIFASTDSGQVQAGAHLKHNGFEFTDGEQGGQALFFFRLTKPQATPRPKHDVQAKASGQCGQAQSKSEWHKLLLAPNMMVCNRN